MPYREPARRSTRYLRLCVDALTPTTPCSVPWDAMDGLNGDTCTRVCPQCTQQVHDLSGMEPAAAEAFLGEHLAEIDPRRRRSRRLRLRLHRRPDGRVMESECPRGAAVRRQRRISMAVIVVVALFAVGAGAMLDHPF